MLIPAGVLPLQDRACLDFGAWETPSLLSQLSGCRLSRNNPRKRNLPAQPCTFPHHFSPATLPCTTAPQRILKPRRVFGVATDSQVPSWAPRGSRQEPSARPRAPHFAEQSCL